MNLKTAMDAKTSMNTENSMNTGIFLVILQKKYKKFPKKIEKSQ